MVEKIEIASSMNGSFVVSDKTLSNLYRHMTDALKQPVMLTARFANERTISTEDLSALLADSSVVNHRIEMLRVSCGGFGEDNQANVTLGSSESRPVTIEIKGNRNIAIALEDSIKNEVGGVKSPLWLLNANQWAVFKLHSSIALGLLVLGILIPITLHSLDIWTLPSFSPLLILFLAFAPIVLGSLGPLLSPSMVFDFGKGAAIERRRRSILRFLFVSVVLALVVGIAVNWISAHLLPAA